MPYTAEKTLEFNNQPFYLKGDKDHACLLLHGLGGGTFELETLAQELHREGYSVEGIIYPGHEQISNKMPDSQWNQWYEHIEQSYKGLVKKYSKVSLVGFSTGCPLSLKLALDNNIEKLVLLSPFLRIKYKWFYLLPLEFYVNTIGRMIKEVPRKLIKLYDSKMVYAVKKLLKFRTFNLNAVRSALELINLVKPHLKKIKLPTLIIQSKGDHIVDPDGAVYLNNNLASQEKELFWLDKSNHTITLDIERETVIRKVIEFMNNDKVTN